MRSARLLLLAVVLAVAGCGYADPGLGSAGGGAGTNLPTPVPSPTPTLAPGADSFNAGEGLPVVTLPDGLKYIDIKVGTGDPPVKGSSITVNYSGWLTNGTLFDSSKKPGGAPATFTIGTGQVIPGWDEAVITMKPGGIRKLILPPALGYGDAGSPPTIPAKSTLVFLVEMISVTAPSPSPSPSPSP